MQKFLQLIKGKKSVTLAIIGAVSLYLMSKGYIGEYEAQLISSILVILGWASFMASKYTK